MGHLVYPPLLLPQVIGFGDPYNQTGTVGLGSAIRGYFSAGGAWYDFGFFTNNDSSGNFNTTTEIGGPTYTGSGGRPGKYMNLAAASTQYHTLADNASLSMGVGASFSVSGWANLASGGGFRRILAKGDRSTAATGEYSLGYNNASRFELAVSDGSAVTVVTDSVVLVSTGTWYFVVGVVDLAAGLVKISVNANPFVTTPFVGPVQDGGNAFRIGNDTVGAGRLWDGSLDTIFVVKRALSLAEITYLYHSGAGRSWGDL